MDLTTAAARLGIALCLGLLVGLQRQRVNHPLAGLRTFAMIAVFGGVCALLGQSLGPWLVPAGLIAAVAAMLVGVWRIGAQAEGLRIVLEGLAPSDRVVVNGVRKIFFPGMPVAPAVVPMDQPGLQPAPSAPSAAPPAQGPAQGPATAP